MKTANRLNLASFLRSCGMIMAVGVTTGLSNSESCGQVMHDDRPSKTTLRITPQRDTATRPDAGASEFRLTSDQQEFYDAARTRMIGDNSSSGVFLEFNEDEILPDAAINGFGRRTGYAFSDGEMQGCVSNNIFPVPLGRAMRRRDQNARKQPGAPLPRSDEYVYDGSDREKKVQVDADWNIYGMDTEDTFGHFDTLDGKRLVSPSNRVEIYAPRFSAVRRIDNLRKARVSSAVTQFQKKEGPVLSRGSDFSSTTKQHVTPAANDAMFRASGFIDQTRGVVSDNVVQLRGSRESFSAYENLDIIKFGRHSASQAARLEAGMQAAAVWQDDVGPQIFTKKTQPIVVNDAATLQQFVVVETDDDNAILKVTKVASKIAARAGEEVDFTIRFDNLSPRRVGNVTIVDNLTGRLAYITRSATCSLDAKFIQKTNESGSLTLRWEIDKPLEPGKGGVVKFKCRVR